MNIEIDPEDRHLLIKHSWYISSVGYLATRVDGKIKHLHQLILPNAKVIDHRNGNKLDYRRSNLRECTHSQNHANQSKHWDNTSGYKGVSLDKRTGRYQASICVMYVRHSGGSHKTPEEAALAYNKLAIKYYGEFAKLNEILTEPVELVTLETT